MERFRAVQRGSDVLKESMLERARLIDRGFSSLSSGESCMTFRC